MNEVKKLKLNEEHLQQEIKELREEIYYLKTRQTHATNESSHFDNSLVSTNSKYICTTIVLFLLPSR